MSTQETDEEPVDSGLAPVNVEPGVGYELELDWKSSAEEKYEGLLAIEHITQLHFVAKRKSLVMKNLITLMNSEEDVKQKRSYLDIITHWQNVLTVYRTHFNTMMIQINKKRVYFANHKEQILNLFKFFRRQVVVLTNMDLALAAQKSALHAAVESVGAEESASEENATMNAYGIPIFKVEHNVPTITVSEFGGSDNRFDMEIMLQKEFENCGQIVAVSVPRAGITRGFISFYTREALQKALKLNKKPTSDGWIMKVTSVNEEEWWKKLRKIRNQSNSSGSSGNQLAGKVAEGKSAPITLPPSSGESKSSESGESRTSKKGKPPRASQRIPK